MSKLWPYIGVLIVGGAFGLEVEHWLFPDPRAPSTAEVSRSVGTPALTPLSASRTLQASANANGINAAHALDVVSHASATSHLEEMLKHADDHADHSVAGAKPEPKPVFSEKQKMLVAAIQRNARISNETESQPTIDGVTLDHMAVLGLGINYFYTINRPYALIDHSAVKERKTAQIQDSLCSNPSVKAINDEGLRYSYHFLSSDDRLVAVIEGDLTNCQG